LNQSGLQNNLSKLLMITMYEITIGYYNVRSSVYGHVVKF